jgi:hypothetical protein
MSGMQQLLHFHLQLSTRTRHTRIMRQPLSVRLTQRSLGPAVVNDAWTYMKEHKSSLTIQLNVSKTQASSRSRQGEMAIPCNTVGHIDTVQDVCLIIYLTRRVRWL